MVYILVEIFFLGSPLTWAQKGIFTKYGCLYTSLGRKLLDRVPNIRNKHMK